MFSPDQIHQRSEDPVIAQATSQAAGEHARRVLVSASEACLQLIRHYGDEAAALYNASVRPMATEATPIDELGSNDLEDMAA